MLMSVTTDEIRPKQKNKVKRVEVDILQETTKALASDLLVKTEDLEKEAKEKKLTRGLIRRMRNNNKDAEEGKYEEREISELQPSYSASTENSMEEEISISSSDEDLIIHNNLDVVVEPEAEKIVAKK